MPAGSMFQQVLLRNSFGTISFITCRFMSSRSSLFKCALTRLGDFLSAGVIEWGQVRGDGGIEGVGCRKEKGGGGGIIISPPPSRSDQPTHPRQTLLLHSEHTRALISTAVMSFSSLPVICSTNKILQRGLSKISIPPLSFPYKNLEIRIPFPFLLLPFVPWDTPQINLLPFLGKGANSGGGAFSSLLPGSEGGGGRLHHLFFPPSNCDSSFQPS